MPELQQPVSGMSEKMRVIRFRMNRETFRFSDEFRLIPRWLVYLVIGLFIVAQAVVQIANHFDPFTGVPPKWAPLALLGIVTAFGIPIACLLLLFGYINRDAKRRGMHSVLWTLLAILVPYLIGVIIYFLLREPRAFNCPQCGVAVSARFNYCPACSCNLHPTCPQCKHEVREGDRFCPHCANALAGATS
jgi:hypothetical protein